MPTDISKWVGSELHDLLGYSAGALVDYIIALAKKSKSSSHLLKALLAQDVPNSPRTEKFAKALFKKIPRKVINRSLKRKERAVAAFISKNATYKLLEDDDEVDDDPFYGPTTAPPPTKSTKKKIAKYEKSRRRKERKKHRRKRKKEISSEENDSSDDNKTERSKHTKKETEEEKKNRERKQDIKERDDFVDRLLQKDLEKTKKFGVNKELEKEKARKLEMAEQDPMNYIPELREKSRQEYLHKREKQQLALLERYIDDEDFVFGDDMDNLSAAERRRHKTNQELLRLAKERRNTATDVTRYKMPDAYEKDGKIDKNKKLEVLTKRYQEEKKMPSEQEVWEDGQTRKALLRFGAQDKKDENHQYVFESQIDFIQQEILEGKNLEDEESHEEADEGLTAFQKLQEERKLLPIFPHREAIMEAVRKYQVLIIVGETGSGKTTQIMQYLYEDDFHKGKMIGCTQPRRVAAMSVAARVSQEVGCKLGYEVGYSIRFEDCTSEKTIIKYMTDGMLLREFLNEPDLAGYNVMMIDEAHERTLHTDVLFGLMKDIARYRDNLKVIISSATLDAEKFSDYFDGAPIYVVPGRRYPVDIYYTKAPEADYLDAVVVTILQIHITQKKGDVLVFLTGQEEIETAEEILHTRVRGMGTKIAELVILPIYGTLPSDLQAKIFEPTPPGARKIVLGTNIAETSLTINGIIYVIDPGFCKQKSYNPRTGMEALIVTPVSRASAQQRAGRAGRVAPGKCFRLFTSHAYANELEENTIPEVQRTNLGNVVLMLKSLGINDLIHFDFMDPPPAETLIRALEQLYALGALNDRGELTKLGRRMAELPMDPMLAKMLIQAEKYECTSEVLTICSMLGCGNAIFYRPKDKQVHATNAHKNFWQPGGDHLTLLNVYQQWVDTNYSIEWCYENFVQVKSMKRARDIREQIEDLLKRVEVEQIESDDDVKIRKSIASGFFYHTARLERHGGYKTIKHSQSVQIHPGSCLFQELCRWVIYYELVLTKKEYMRQVIQIEPEWLIEIAPHYYKKHDVLDKTKFKLPKKRGASTADLNRPR